MARGHKTGGRQKGTRNHATAAKAQAIAESGLTPLDFLIEVMRDESQDLAVRIDAAKSAAPYVHPKLASIEHSGPAGGPIEVDAVDDLTLARWIAMKFETGRSLLDRKQGGADDR
jgi:hypothetical protein